MNAEFSRKLVLCLMAMALLSPIGMDSVQAAKKLRWKVAKGDTFSLEMKQDMQQTSNVGTQKIKTGNKMTMNMTWKVDSVDDEGLIHMTQTHDRIRMSVSVPGQGNIEYDSDEEEAEGLAKTFETMLKPMVGAKFEVVMNDRGEVTDFIIPENAFKGLESNPMMKQFFSKDSLKEMTTKGSPVFPEESIDKGHSWDNKFEVKTPIGTMTTDSKYTYRGEEQKDGRPLERIDVAMKMDFGKEPGPGGVKLELKDQESSGTTWFDSENGHFVGTEVKQKFTMVVNAGGQNIESATDSNMTMTVKKIE